MKPLNRLLTPPSICRCHQTMCMICKRSRDSQYEYSGYQRVFAAFTIVATKSIRDVPYGHHVPALMMPSPAHLPEAVPAWTQCRTALPKRRRSLGCPGLSSASPSRGHTAGPDRYGSGQPTSVPPPCWLRAGRPRGALIIASALLEPLLSAESDVAVELVAGVLAVDEVAEAAADAALATV